MAGKIHPTSVGKGPAKGSVSVNAPFGIDIIASGPSPNIIPYTTHPSACKRFFSICNQCYYGVVGQIALSYKRLPWITRKTINVSVQLYMVLYIFFSVPFRVAFYYDPYPRHDNSEIHHWTSELSIFIILDTIADIIGLIAFVGFYRVWKVALHESSTFTSVQSGKDRKSDADRHSTSKVVVRRRPSSELQLAGIVNWTISSIKPLSSMPGDESNYSSSQRYITARNVEFVLELIALIPIDVIPVGLGTFNALHLVRMTKLCRLYRLRPSIARIAKLYSDRAWVQYLSSSGIDSLVRTIGHCVGLIHWAACGYMLIAHVQCGITLEACNKSVETSWVVRDHLLGASVTRKYGRTLYWASRTLVLLGYDDVTPVSTAETLYVVAIVILGALFGTSLLANFLFLFRFRNARYAAYSAHVDNAREYMRLRNLPRSVRQQVTAYYNYSWSMHRSLSNEEALQLLPQHLQSKVITTLRGNRIAQVCFLMKETVEFINELALALVRRVYSPGDQIIEPKINAQMFFVIQGQVLLSTFNGLKPHECKAGDFFAEMCLLFPEVYLQKAIAKTFCELYVLTKAKFDEVLSEFYRESEKIVRLKMAERLEKYSLQLRKTKKILGLHDGFENLNGRISTGRASASRSKGSLGRSKGSIGRTSLGRSKMGKSTCSLNPGAVNTREILNWRIPGSSFRTLWDTARLVAIIYVAFEVPYFAVFISMTEGRHMFIVDAKVDARYVATMIAEAFFGIDLILRSRYFAFLDESVMLGIIRPDLIFAAYKNNGLFLDLLAWLPVGVILDSLSTDSFPVYSSFFRLLRLLRVRLVPELLQDLSDLYGTSSKLQIVVSLVLGVTLMLHVIGCAWFEMALVPPDNQSDHGDGSIFIAELTRSECLQQATNFQNCSWVKFDCYAHLGMNFPHENPDSMYQANFAYLRSVYWAMVTLTAVGYGDIVAYSTAESYFAALWIFVGGIINFAVMGAMSSTISNMTAAHHHHMEKINMVNSIMERVSISKELSAEIRRFYHQVFVGHKETYESQLLSNLPDQLCYQISSLLHSTAVKSVSLFDSASIEFLRAVTGKFRHRSYQNGEAVCLEGDICRKFFVFLQGSKVNIFFRSRKVPIRALQAGDSYAVNEFLLRRIHPATLVAASLVHASVMTREQFDIIQRKFANDLRDMKEEAQNLWTEEKKVMKLVMANLAKPKLQPHVLQTPSLFYQRDNTVITRENEKSQRFGTPPIKFKTLWNALITCWNLYNATFVIFRICFHSHLHFSRNMSVTVWIADLMCDICFAVDIYLRLFYFGCSDVGFENLMERKEVDKHYLRSSTFKWDILASLPVYTPFASGSMITGLCRLPRLVRCIDLWNYLDDVIMQIQQQFASHHVSAYLSPVKLIIILVLVAHYVGCIFYLISERECQQLERCWIAHDPILHEYHDSAPILYAKTFYWAITTLCLVGSREIVPRGMAGSLWTGFTCLCCTFVIGHIVGEISELILELGKETKEYKSRITSFENFAKEHDLSTALRERVTHFFRVEFEKTKGTNVCRAMHDLSANLRLKFMLELYGRSIELLPISTFLTTTQINNLALRLQSELFIPGDNIVVEGTFGSRLCTLKKGMAAAYWTKSVASVAVLSEGAFFGEIAFFLPNQRRLASVRATTTCEVLHIAKQDWQELWVPTDDESDNNVLKHAQYAILGWVNSRLQRYQRGCLRTACRAKGAAVPRQPTIKETISRKASKLFAKDKALIKGSHVLLWAPTPPRKVSKVEICRMFVSPTMQLLEKKAEYILSKSSACTQPLGDKEPKRRTSSGSNKADDLRHRQFIIDINPVNEYISDSLGVDTIHELEAESWARFKLLMALQHVVGKLLIDLIPADVGAKLTSPPRMKTLVKVMKPKQLRPFRFDERAKRKWSAAITQMAASVSRRKTIGPEAAMVVSEGVAIAQPSVKLAPVRRRSFPALIFPHASPVHDQSKSESSPAPTLIRCRSLQFFGDTFFSDMSDYKNYNDGRKGESGIDFEILQRCQRPQYATQLHWYHRYRQWRAVVIPRLERLADLKQKKNQISPLSEDMKLAGTHRAGNTRLEVADTTRLPIPNQQALRAVISDFESKQFIKCVKQVGKAWDLLMLLIAMYHLLVTPFKVCFSHEITELAKAALRTWSGIEIFLDLLSFIDVVHKYYHISPTPNGLLTTNGITSALGVRLSLVFNSDLRTDIAAILPLELLLLVPGLRLPILHIQNSAEAVHASWWTTRWVLRVNRMLLIQRIQPLSEELFQFAIQDMKVPVSESLLYFLRSLASYLTMGHILACLWFVTSDIGLWLYGVSWLSTPGMLTYISTETTTADIGESHRFLQEIASSFMLESVSLTRQYLRSLLFSMECISTLFYGDIISMNPLELIVEIGITFWAISIYGALVGAQGEWIDSQARQEASFEQNLAELQHFLNLNDVPKGLRRQIKAYYARIWRRHQGKSEFASVANVSRALYEDVVLATQSDFAAQVGVFQIMDEHFLRGLLVCLEYVVCSEGEEVVSKGDTDRSMYFIAQGRILVRMEAGESMRERGEFFGEFALLYGISRLETCIALDVSELYRLDHEPYEQLLQDFPGYRRRNKQAWTTPVAPNHSVDIDTGNRTDSATALIGMSPVLASRVNVKSLDLTTMQHIEIEKKLPHTYVYKSTMEMLAQLQTMHPEEVKSLILKCRAGSRKRLSRELAHVDEE